MADLGPRCQRQGRRLESRPTRSEAKPSGGGPLQGVRAFAVLALAGACAGPPPAALPAACPPPGPRTAHEVDAAALVPGDATRGERLFAEGCNGCHAAEALQRAPDAPARTPRLDCPAWLATAPDGYLYTAINRGPGRQGHGGLAPLGLHLAPAEVSDLVAYLRSLERRDR